MNFPEGITELEKALMVNAYLVVRHGDAFVPTLERLEREVAAERQRNGRRDRAREILRGFTREVRNAPAV